MTEGSPRILLIGTADTKADELLYLRGRIEAGGGTALVMDVGVLDGSPFVPEIANAEVAAAAGTTTERLAALGDENAAMSGMARGAARLAAELHAAGRIDGLLALGGTMGTDLALDAAAALPVGVPKVVLSTIAYSHLLPPERIPPDLVMLLWSGGLYGLNDLCRSSLAQAAGAVLGACRMAEPPRFARPLVGITSLGSSVLSYMKRLKPALEARGYEVAVFHTTGMGGRAFEGLAEQGRFAAVFDFSLQELANHLGGSCVTAGASRLTGAGRAGVPQIVAPGATDMVDFPAWCPPPARFAGRPSHAHNRLIASGMCDAPERREIAAEIARRLREAQAPSCLLLPLRGIEEWDREGQPLHDADGLRAFVDALRGESWAPAECVEVDAHINDTAFTDAALAVFDRWAAAGRIAPGTRAALPA
ncbi:MAG: Tm-1-like ATP-binding domain-containing protein [Rhodocyclaceae bacterium]|jgi:uncharacterized protein (UPF0261 family)|nr:hypothetical protein [Rhodocyclaceae bacterium]MBZ0145176.1 Tm-1-like ATP-binding domain-containing protein [Rhodocyclaceae bacterium]MCC6880046.1 Tm-1-like ATP-binding domain-containing protein [Rhodocyclaceae bacterium]MCL4682527.1 Tm-1-like ATP-binding domain-containing protein [Rhodocyclaceae bacterium]